MLCTNSVRDLSLRKTSVLCMNVIMLILLLCVLGLVLGQEDCRPSTVFSVPILEPEQTDAEGIRDLEFHWNTPVSWSHKDGVHIATDFHQ